MHVGLPQAVPRARRPDRHHEPILVAAVAREKTELVKELMSLGTRIDSNVANRARQDGLESMLEFLQQHMDDTTV
jgi:hypothetical protein